VSIVLHKAKTVLVLFCLEVNKLLEVVMRQVGYANRQLVGIQEFMVKV